MSTSRFRSLPITKKLILVMLLTSVTAVLVVSGVFGATEALNYRSSMADDVTTLGDVIGTNSTAAITFEDAELAGRVLASLSADSSVISATMFLADGSRLAGYAAEQARDDWQIGPERLAELLATVTQTEKPVEQFVGLSFFDAVRPVFFDNELIGMLHVRASLDELVMTLRRIGVMAIGTVVFAIFIAYLLSFRLQAVISRPIVELSKLMNKVSEEQDYSLRARPSGRDEIGTLMTGFNDMLTQISVRDVKLAEANDQLKIAVTETLEAKEAAELASSAKSDFLARMSHEIRTPMNGVLGMTDLLLSSDLKGSERKFAETIRQSGEALLALINDILDFSKIEAGKLVIEESDFDLRDVIEGVVDLLYNRAHDQGVELIGAIRPDVGTWVRGDSIRLRQILMNLVGNAVKFTHEGEIVVELTQESGPGKQSMFRFAVHDTGIGIEQQQLQVIFDRFAQADVSTTREYGGTGLGLAISRQLVELMGGEIGVTSDPGGGSTFWFALPLEPVKVSDASSAVEFSPMPGIRALVVDDNETNREVLSRQLCAWDIDVTVAADAKEALDIMGAAAERGQRFELVLLDFFMPRKDGMDLAADIRDRADFGEPRLLMVSSAGSEYNEAAMLEAGIDMYLSKPVRRKVLYDSIVDIFAIERFANRPPREQNAAAAEDQPQMNLTVLLAEDNPTNMQVARHVLYSLGCHVIEAENGREALDVISQRELDLVLMDCQMPVMDGYTATRQQRAREERSSAARLPIVALTANALPEDRKKCLDAGMDDFISKPFTRDILAATISRWCDAKPAPVVSRSPDDHGVEVDESILNLEALEQIAELDPDNSGALLSSVIETYLENAESLMRSLRDSISSTDKDGIIQASHSLKSSSANVGAVRLSEIMSVMEQAARTANLDVAVANFDPAEREYDKAVNQLQVIQREAAA